MNSFRVASAALVLMACSSQGFADSSTDSRVKRLEEMVQTLERRVVALESQGGIRSVLREEPPAVVPPVLTPPPVSSPANVNWRKLKRGMSEAEVERLLGSPSSVRENEFSITWTYRVPSLGFIEFDAKSRAVDSWSEP